MTLRYGSVCSGIEAASLAWAGLGWTPAWFAEIEKFPSAVLAHRYGSNMPGAPLSRNAPPNLGDFTKIGEEHGPIDLLVGGTPCQSFSIAGQRLGLDDPRGNLTLEYARLARRLRPRWIVWENVPGVLSDDDGRSFGQILATFAGHPDGHVFDCPAGGWRGGGIVEPAPGEYGRGLAWRVLDAQYFGVPQRRRRLFVVGYSGDWRPAAAVLFEPESLRGDPAPRRKTGQGVAPTISARTKGGGGLGTDFDLDGGLVEHCYGPGDRPSGARGQGPGVGEADHAAAGGLIDCTPDGIPEIVGAMAHQAPGGVDTQSALNGYILPVAHALRGEGFDASEDGTGRGTPIVPVVAGAICRDSFTGGAGGRPEGAAAGHFVPVEQPYTLAIRGRGDSHNLEYRQDGTANAILTPNGGRAGIGVGAIAFSAKDHGADAVEDIAPALRAMGHGDSHANGGGQVAVAFEAMAVRRLTPTECERLQGFDDDRTQIPWRGKAAADCPDGPRYKAIGNSMAVPVMRWIGERIDLFEREVRPLLEMKGAAE